MLVGSISDANGPDMVKPVKKKWITGLTGLSIFNFRTLRLPTLQIGLKYHRILIAIASKYIHFNMRRFPRRCVM